jgi:hypothetical protein
VAFANPFADTSENRDTFVQFLDRMHKLHNKNRLAHTSPTEQPGLAAANEGAQKVDHFDAGFEYLRYRFGGMQRPWARHDVSIKFGSKWRCAIEGFAEQIHQATETLRSDRHMQR